MKELIEPPEPRVVRSEQDSSGNVQNYEIGQAFVKDCSVAIHCIEHVEEETSNFEALTGERTHL